MTYACSPHRSVPSTTDTDNTSLASSSTTTSEDTQVGTLRGGHVEEAHQVKPIWAWWFYALPIALFQFCDSFRIIKKLQ